MDDFERRTLEALATLQTNQQVTNTQLSFVSEKIEKIEKKLARQEEKDSIFGEKVAALDEKTKCLPELQKDVNEIEVDRKRKWKIAYVVFASLVGISALTISLSQDCSIEKLSTQSSIRAHAEDD